MRITIDVDMSKVKLPDYEYTYEGLIDELGIDEANKYIWKRHKVGFDGLADNYDREFSEPVSAKTTAKFKKQLAENIREHIKALIEDYRCNESEIVNLDEAITAAGESIYTEIEDLSWDLIGQVKIKVLEK